VVEVDDPEDGPEPPRPELQRVEEHVDQHTDSPARSIL
jgi:hypothetical protein